MKRAHGLTLITLFAMIGSAQSQNARLDVATLGPGQLGLMVIGLAAAIAIARELCAKPRRTI